VSLAAAHHQPPAGARLLPDLLAGLAEDVPPLSVSGLATDSRSVEPGDLFLAVRGRQTHGLAFVDRALARGAAAVAWEPAPGVRAPQCPVPQLRVENLSLHVGEIAARFYAHPSRAVWCAGVTGTDGKTSTAYLTAQAFERLGLPCVYAGTLGEGRPGMLRKATHTTADALTVQRRLAAARAAGAQACAMEVSSHALDQHRVGGVAFRAAALTNVGRDHLDYHGSQEAYAAAKRRLFDWPTLSAVILNRDDAYGARWAQELARTPSAASRLVQYGLEGTPPRAGRYVLGRALTLHAAGLRLELDSSWGRARLESRLLGRFNAYNLLAAGALLLAYGIPLAQAAEALAHSATVPGRIEGFRGPRAAPLVVVDYAHTPQALAAVLQALRAHCTGKLICVFGCGGDRDRGKRPLMGAAAASGADRVILTDDNPRSEDPAAIVAQILAGMREAQGLDSQKIQVIHDRAQAIRTAVEQARPGDVVLVAGKGHEDEQIYATERRPFSDRAFVAELLGAESLAEARP
jgi:UDP-N-acetylmuramoyl-L-alanyl-D-glutamate--2,6-diaminopimelate ligase